MNYVQLNLGGKDRSAKLGLGFLEKAMKGENLSIQELFQKIESEAFTFLPTLLYYSLAYNCDRAKQTVDFEKEDVFDWIDEVGINSDEFKKFQIAFFQSIKVHLPEENQSAIEETISNLEGKTKPQKISGKIGK